MQSLKEMDREVEAAPDRPRCKRNLTISEAFGCGHVFGL
jgi:hypothetical protein